MVTSFFSAQIIPSDPKHGLPRSFFRTIATCAYENMLISRFNASSEMQDPSSSKLSLNTSVCHMQLVHFPLKSVNSWYLNPLVTKLITFMNSSNAASVSLSAFSTSVQTWETIFPMSSSVPRSSSKPNLMLLCLTLFQTPWKTLFYLK